MKSSGKEIVPIDEEIFFGDEEIIVSKTDLSGKITYANDVFCRVAECETDNVIGVQHNIIRHPDMPRAVFHLLWNYISEGKEIFAYVKNMSFTGKYYWVIAHVTPSYCEKNRKIIGYHSNRRKPEPKSVKKIEALYKELRHIELSATSKKAGIEASLAHLHKKIEASGMAYDEYIWGV